MKKSARLVLLVLVLWSAHLASAQQDEDGDVVSTDSPDVDEQNGIDQFTGVTAGRIAGGVKASGPYQPYGALIAIGTKFSNLLLSGAIISNTEVLTSASALLRFNDLTKITVYVTDTASMIDTTENTVKSYKIHSGFNSTTRANDVAIITIDGTFAGQNVQPIPIATTEIAVSTTNRTKCVVLGWGENEYTIDNNLDQVDYELMTDQECEADGPSPPSIMCAKRIVAFACKYDGGAPLICNGQLYGILTDQSSCSKYTAPPYQKFAKLPNITLPLEKPATQSTSNITLPTAPRKNYVSCP